MTSDTLYIEFKQTNCTSIMVFYLDTDNMHIINAYIVTICGLCQNILIECVHNVVEESHLEIIYTLKMEPLCSADIYQTAQCYNMEDRSHNWMLITN
jgi:hypothetical protein